MKTLIVQTRKPKEVIDLTEEIEKIIAEGNLTTGLCHLFTQHTTVALATADLDPGSDLDFLDAFSHLIPPLTFRHPHDPTHMPDHILSSLIGTSLLLPFQGEKLCLGSWQRVVMFEFSGPRERKILINFLSIQDE